MLINFAVTVVLVGLVFAGVMLWKERINSAGFLGIAVGAAFAGIAVANLPRVTSVAVEAGATTSIKLQLQEAKETVNQAREIKEQIEALVKRVETGEREVLIVKEALKENDQKLTGVERRQIPQRLSLEQQATLVKLLSPFPGQKVSIACVLSDEKTCDLAKDFQSVFSEVKWDFGGPPTFSRSVFTANPKGVEVHLNREDVNAGRISEAVKVLVTTLVQLGTVPEKTIFRNTEVPPGQVTIRVGSFS